MKSAKTLIRDIRKQLEKAGNEQATSTAVARAVGVSATSITNWEDDRCNVSEKSLSMLEEALAKLTSKEIKSLAAPPEISTAGHANGTNGTGHGGSRIKKLLGDQTTVVSVSEDGKAEARVLGSPVDSGMRIPNMREEEAKLASFISSIGLKPISPQAPVLCDDGSVVWHFVATFTHKTPGLIIKNKNEHNREVGPEHAKKYGIDMAGNNWGYTAEPIIFSRDGNLLDGQNRMNALRAFYKKYPTAKLISFMVVFGLNPSVSTFMGRPYVRTNKHQNQVEGRSYAHVRTPTMNLIHRFERSDKEGDKDGHDYLEEVASPGVTIKLKSSRQTELNEIYSDELEHALEIAHGLNWGIGTGVLSKHVGVFMFMLMNRKSPEAARYFMKSLVDGNHAFHGSPVFALRDKLNKFATARAKDVHKQIVSKVIGKGDGIAQIARGSEALTMRYIASAWNAFCGGRNNRKIKASVESTAQVLNSLASPGPKALESSKLFTQSDFEAALAKGRACRQTQQEKMLKKNRDDGDLKLAAITQAIDTE